MSLRKPLIESRREAMEFETYTDGSNSQFRSKSRLQIYKAIFQLIFKIKKKAPIFWICIIISVVCCFPVLKSPISSFPRTVDNYSSGNMSFYSSIVYPFPYKFSGDCKIAIFPENDEKFKCIR
jgi:hypothetical protein